MKALVLEKNQRLVLRERNMPKVTSHDSVLVKVAACGVCGSDIPRAFKGGAYHYPLVLGHEFSGTVAEDVPHHSLALGDRVVAFPLLPCRRCNPCQTGDYAQCVNYDYLGSRSDGGLEEFVRVPASNLFKIPPHVNILHAAMVEPAAVALHGVRKLRISAGETGVVFGGGPIGNLTAQWLRIHGCREVVVVDIENEKLAVAERMGFRTVNALKADPVASILELTGGRGAAKVVEAVGLPGTFLQSIQAAARFGEIVFMGNLHGEFCITETDFSNILRKELTIHGTWNSKIVPNPADDWTTVLNYMDRELVIAPLITDTPSLEEGQSVFESILHRKQFHNKVIFRVSSDE